MTRTWIRRAFAVGWLSLGVLGALNDTVATRACQGRLDLQLPHLRSGHRMFIKVPRRVLVFEYFRADGVRHNVAELVRRPSPGYKRARVALDLRVHRGFLRDICRHSVRDEPEAVLTFIVSEYWVRVDPLLPTHETLFRCNRYGLHRR